uniref:Uncharacterized protein n=1 Tax=viral metagenome TaxID=1070528 RepID=A0A6C0KDN8_9ZZZZ
MINGKEGKNSKNTSHKIKNYNYKFILTNIIIVNI